MIEAGRRVSIFVGALVVAVGVTLAAILVFVGSATRLFAETTRISACFSDVTGLRAGASVLRAGVSVGTVRAISLDEACGGRARVELAVDARALERLSADSHARLVTMGLLGDRLVALVPGHGATPLPAGAIIEGRVPPDPSAVIAQAGEAFDILVRIAHRVDETLSGADLQAALADLVATSQSLRRVLERAERGPGLLHLLIYDRALAQQARAIGPAAQAVGAAAADTRETIGRLDRAAADLSAIVAYVKSGQGTLGGVIYDPAIYEDLRTIVGGVRRNVILRTLGRFVLKHH